MTIDWMRRLREEGRFTQEQAEAIASMPEDRYITRELLDATLTARLAELETRLNTRMDAIGWRLAGLATVYTVVILGAIYFVLPRLPR
jgi:hypothetical protein